MDFTRKLEVDEIFVNIFRKIAIDDKIKVCLDAHVWMEKSKIGCFRGPKSSFVIRQNLRLKLV